MKRSKIPPGKRVLNTHISVDEHEFLQGLALRTGRTITGIIREWIQRERNGDVHEQVRLLTERVKALERRQ